MHCLKSGFLSRSRMLAEIFILWVECSLVLRTVWLIIGYLDSRKHFLKIKAKFVNLEFWQKHFFFVCDLQALALDHLPRSFDTPVSVRPPLGLGGNPWVRWQRLGLDGNLLLANTWGDPQARTRGHVEIFSSHRAQPHVEVSGFPRLASQLRRHLVTLSGVAFQEFE